LRVAVASPNSAKVRDSVFVASSGRELVGVGCIVGKAVGVLTVSGVGDGCGLATGVDKVTVDSNDRVIAGVTMLSSVDIVAVSEISGEAVGV